MGAFLEPIEISYFSVAQQHLAEDHPGLEGEHQRP